jgi:hypothetical protein
MITNHHATVFSAMRCGVLLTGISTAEFSSTVVPLLVAIMHGVTTRR